jgi:hypothetical protein
MDDLRTKIARIILGPSSSFNYGNAKDWKLAEWTQYPHVSSALAKADEILALFPTPGGEG